MPAQGLSAAERLEPSFESPIITITPSNNCSDNVKIRYGEITGIFGNTGCGKSLLGLHAVTTHLLAHPTSHAAWIDTVGVFSPRFLKEIVEERILCARTEAERQGDAVEGKLRVEEVAGMVEGVLDRVWVMRAFDWWGVADAVGEVREHVEANFEVQPDDNPDGGEQGEEVVAGCREVDREIDREGREGIGRDRGSQCIGVTEIDSPISPPSSPLPPPSLPESSPLSSPPPSSQLFPPSPTFLQSIALPLPNTLTRGRTEIPDSDAGSDEDIIISSISSSPPIHNTPSPPRYPDSEASLGIPTQSSSQKNPYFGDEIPASTDTEENRGDEQINEEEKQYYGGEIPTLQSQDSQTYINALARVASIDCNNAEPPLPSGNNIRADQYRMHLKVPVIGILVIDTITHPVESLLTKAAASAGVAAGGRMDGANTAGVGGALALLEKFFGNLTEFVHRRGVSVLLLNSALHTSLFPPNPTWQPMEVVPAFGPMFQNILDTSILLSRGGEGESGTGRRHYYNHSSRGVPWGVQHANTQIEIEFRVVHDRNGEWTGETGKIGLGLGLGAGAGVGL